jgi:transcriptional regulator with XRE-family HTH domain
MNEKNIGTFAPRLRAEREKLGLSQVEMAEKLGITARTQRNYEMGTRVPDADYLISASKVGVDLAFLLHGTDASDAGDEAETALLHIESAFGLKREDLQRAVAMGLLGEEARNGSAYGMDPEILFSELRQCSPVIQAIFDRETSIDTGLLTEILVGIDAALEENKLTLTPAKKAQTVAMLYRFYKPDGKVLPGMIEETVKLTAS